MRFNLIKNLISARGAFWVMALLLALVLYGFYFSPKQESAAVLFSSPGFLAILCLLGFSLVGCTVKRAVMYNKMTARYHMTKNWGSVLFHGALFLILLGFGISSLFGMRGTVIIPEGVTINFPENIQMKRTARWHDFEQFQANLTKMELTLEDKRIGQVRGNLVFTQEDHSDQQLVEINRPAKFKGYYWRSYNWGYSTKVLIKKGTKVVVDDFINIATHQDQYYYDKIILPEGITVEIAFYPTVNQSGDLLENQQYPKNPAISINVQENGKPNVLEQKRAVVLLGEQGETGGYQVAFQGYRFWEQFDVSSDPGEPLIFLGGILAVLGLAIRVLYEYMRGQGTCLKSK